MSPAPRPLTAAELAEFVAHAKEAYSRAREEKAEVLVPAPEFGPGMQWCVTWSPILPCPAFTGRMRMLERSWKFWQRVELETMLLKRDG